MINVTYKCDCCGTVYSPQDEIVTNIHTMDYIAPTVHKLHLYKAYLPKTDDKFLSKFETVGTFCEDRVDICPECYTKIKSMIKRL